jgi:hypothetical protein
MAATESNVTVFTPNFLPTTYVTTEVQVAEGVLRIFDGQHPVAMFAPGHWTHFSTNRAQTTSAATTK